MKMFEKIKIWWNCRSDHHEWGEEQSHSKPMPLLSIEFRKQCKHCGEIIYWRRGATLVMDRMDPHWEPIEGDGWEQFDEEKGINK